MVQSQNKNGELLPVQVPATWLPLLDEVTGAYGVFDIRSVTRAHDGRNYISAQDLRYALGQLAGTAEAKDPNVHAFDCGLSIDTARRLVSIGGVALKKPFPNLEFSLLEALAAARDTLLSRETILDIVWEGRDVGEKVVDVHVMRLRRRLLDDVRDVASPNYGLIESVRAHGYRIGQRAFSAEPLVHPDTYAALLTEK